MGRLNSANLGNHDDLLLGVDASSSSDAWAVGYYGDGSNDRTLGLHERATPVSCGDFYSTATPNPGSEKNQLNSVSMRATARGGRWASRPTAPRPTTPW